MVTGSELSTAPAAVEFIDDDAKLSLTEESELDPVPAEGRPPTALELATLRRVSAPVPWPAYLVCFAELGPSRLPVLLALPPRD